MFKKKNILVVGDIMLDKYSHGNVTRISPEAPVPIVDNKKTIYKPGGASNDAQNLSALGMNVTLLGITGDDPELKELIKVIRHTNIRFDPVKDISIRTTLKSRIIGNDQHLMRLDHEDKNKSSMHNSLLNKLTKYIDDTDLIVISDYDKGAIKPIAKKIIKLANENNIKVIIDPKGLDYSIYKGAFLVKPNELEFETIVGKLKNNKDMIQKGRELKDSLNLNALLLTLGKNGMILFDKKTVITFPLLKRKYMMLRVPEIQLSLCSQLLCHQTKLSKNHVS